MKLEEEVVCRELSQELEKAGYLQEGYFWWVREGEHYCCSEKCKAGKYELWPIGPPYDFPFEGIAAPTVSELGKRLPPYYYSLFGDGKWHCGRDDIKIGTAVADTEADARAKCWLYLKKEGLI